VSVDAELVFLGYGINAPEQKWNDYQGVDVRGKVVMIMVNDPPATASEPNLFGGKALTYYGRWTYKYEEAARQGAAGVLLIHTTESASYPWTVVQNAWSGTQYSLPVEVRPADAQAQGVGQRPGGETNCREGGQGTLDELRRAAAVRGFTAVPLGCASPPRCIRPPRGSSRRT
jgi:Zn-dependent M28 family amino/carboxypeptidase